MKFYLIVGFLIMAKCAFCQTDNLQTFKIDSIAASIDSLKNYGSLIEDGTMEIKRKGIIKKIFTKRLVGGYSNAYYSNDKTKELYKVVHQQNLNKPKTIKYYFNNGSLILVKITTMENGSIDKVLSFGQYYFLRDSLIKRTGKDSLAKPVFILKNGKELLKDWDEEHRI